MFFGGSVSYTVSVHNLIQNLKTYTNILILEFLELTLMLPIFVKITSNENKNERAKTL